MYLYRLLSGARTMLNHVIYYFTGDNTTYKVPEYFSYNENSFYDSECELDKYRLEQPTASSQNHHKPSFSNTTCDLCVCGSV